MQHNLPVNRQISFYKTSLFVFALIASALLLIFLFPIDYLLCTGPYWHNPASEVNITLASFRYYIAEAISYPFGLIKGINAPEGINILYESGVPLFAFIIKLINHLFNIKINGIYLWSLGCTLLQGISFAYLITAFNIHNKTIIALSAIIGMLIPAYLWRLEHTLALPHFFIIYGLAFYFFISNNSDPIFNRRILIASAIMIVLSYSLNPYITAMTLPFFGVTLLHGLSSRKTTLVDTFKALMIVGFGMILTGYFFGYFYGKKLAAAAGGFDFYSMNFLGPIDIGYSSFAKALHLASTPINPNGGQQEGMQYLGAGCLFLIITALIMNARNILNFMRNNALLVILLIGMFLFSLSNKIYFGNSLIIEYKVPKFLLSLTETFRAPGRFFWPIAYFLIAISIATISLKAKKSTPLLLIIAISLQVIDTHHLRLELWNILKGINDEGYPAGKYVSPYNLGGVPSTTITELIQSHKEIKQYPSWWCGGLGDQLFEMEINFIASRYLVKQSSFYTARANKDCYKEGREVSSLTKFEPNTLYIFGQRHADLSRLYSQGLDLSACRVLSNFIVQPSGGYYYETLPVICSLQIKADKLDLTKVPKGWGATSGLAAIDLTKFSFTPRISHIATSSSMNPNLYPAENLIGTRIDEGQPGKDKRFPSYWLAESGKDGWVLINLNRDYKIKEIHLLNTSNDGVENLFAKSAKVEFYDKTGKNIYTKVVNVNSYPEWTKVTIGLNVPIHSIKVFLTKGKEDGTGLNKIKLIAQK